MENLARIIAEHPFCKDLETYYIDLLTNCASNVRCEKDFYLFREGGEANHFYLIREGKVALEAGAGPVPLCSWRRWLKARCWDGPGCFPPYRWRFTARAVKAVRAIAVDGKCLRAKCERNPHLGYELLKRTVEIMGQRLEASRFRVLDLYSADGQRDPQLEFRQ